MALIALAQFFNANKEENQPGPIPERGPGAPAGISRLLLELRVRRGSEICRLVLHGAGRGLLGAALGRGAREEEVLRLAVMEALLKLKLLRLLHLLKLLRLHREWVLGLCGLRGLLEHGGVLLGEDLLDEPMLALALGLTLALALALGLGRRRRAASEREGAAGATRGGRLGRVVHGVRRLRRVRRVGGEW